MLPAISAKQGMEKSVSQSGLLCIGALPDSMLKLAQKSESECVSLNDNNRLYRPDNGQHQGGVSAFPDRFRNDRAATGSPSVKLSAFYLSDRFLAKNFLSVMQFYDTDSINDFHADVNDKNNMNTFLWFPCSVVKTVFGQSRVNQL